MEKKDAGGSTGSVCCVGSVRVVGEQLLERGVESKGGTSRGVRVRP